MELLEGYELIELTDDKIVQEKRIGETGIMRVIGNPNPPKEEQQKTINNVTEILFKGYRRSLREEQKKEGA